MAYEFKKLNDVEIVETPIDTANVLIEEDGVIKKAPKSAVGGGGIEVASAEVGQTIVVKAVDENGKPTEWECADMSSGALWVTFSNSDSTNTVIDTCNTNPEDIVLALENGTPVFGKFVNSDGEVSGRDIYNVITYDVANSNILFMTAYQSGASSVKHKFISVSPYGVSQTSI